MEHLNDLIEKIQTDPLAAMSVVDLSKQPFEKGYAVIRNATNDVFQNSEHQSVEGFFESLFKAGITSVRIFERRKSGNAFITIGEPFEFDMKAKDEKPTETPVQPNMASVDLNVNAGLHGAGLNAIQVYHAQDYPRLAGAFAAVESENKRHVETIFDLKKKILELEHSEKVALGQQSMIANLGQKIPDALHGLAAIGLDLSRFTKNVAGANDGLAGSVSQTHLDAWEIFKKLDEDTVYTMGEIARNLNNELFVNDLMALLAKFNIIPVAQS